jgi:oligosaccharide repeat unit polymerase
MAEGNFSNNTKHLFFIPSFYGAMTWGIWLLLYMMKLIRVDNCSNAAMGIFLFVEAMFILSAFVSLPYYTNIIITKEDGSPADAESSTGCRFSIKAVILLLHVIGFLGLVQYIIEFSKNLGGITGFFLALVNEAYAIRWEAETSTSIGTQLSYFGWIAIGLTVYQFAKKKISGYWLIPAFAQFLGNLMFIDRTRPTWILFTCLLMILPAMEKLNIKRIFRWTISSLVLTITLFWLVAEWTGKTSSEGQYEDSLLPGITQEIYVYGVSGFAYFNKMLESNEQISYKPERFFYPLLKSLARLGLASEPPSQILEFYDVPFSTNVGTFLEPFYRDGGLVFVLCGVIFYSFGFDTIGMLLLKSKKPLAIYAWSNLCFTTFIGFFTPKISSLPIWLFTTIGFWSLVSDLAIFDTHQRKSHCQNNK